MKLFLILIFLIKINYPDNTYETKLRYDKMMQNAIDTYCFLGIDFEITEDSSEADLIVVPKVYFMDYYTLGFMRSTIHHNTKIHGTPIMYLGGLLNPIQEEYVMKHEFGHYLGLTHSIDTMSLLWEYYEFNNSDEYRGLTRHDSITLIYKFNEFKPHK